MSITGHHQPYSGAGKFSIHGEPLMIGTCGWLRAAWQGLFYPPALMHAALHPWMQACGNGVRFILEPPGALYYPQPWAGF